jgi:hypothetical protein
MLAARLFRKCEKLNTGCMGCNIRQSRCFRAIFVPRGQAFSGLISLSITVSNGFVLHCTQTAVICGGAKGRW